MDYRFLRFPDGKGKAVTLSYDDGTIHDVKLSEIINRYGLKCTFNLNSERLLSGNGLTVEQAKKLLLPRKAKNEALFLHLQLRPYKHFLSL